MSLINGGLVPTIQSETDFSQLWDICEVLDDDELIVYMMQRY